MKTLHVEPQLYLNQIERHLRQNRPANLPASGTAMKEHALKLAEQVADRVNSALDQQEKASTGKGLHQRLKAERTAQVMAESEALRELLPWDPKEAKLIGPSGGYED